MLASVRFNACPSRLSFVRRSVCSGTVFALEKRLHRPFIALKKPIHLTLLALTPVAERHLQCWSRVIRLEIGVGGESSTFYGCLPKDEQTLRSGETRVNCRG